MPAPQGAAFVDSPSDAIEANPRQPRQVFDEDDLAELVESIREVGLLQPVVVRRVGDAYELVMGERRLRATRRAGLATIPAIVRDTADHDLLRDALLENLHRVQLNPLEEAAAYQQMLDDFGCTQEELGDSASSARARRSPTPSGCCACRRRSSAAWRPGVLSAGTPARSWCSDDPVEQERLAQRIVAEGLSVRSVEEIVAMGERAERPRRTTVPRTPSPRASHLAEVLTDSFDTRVNVQIGKTKGRITIEFAARTTWTASWRSCEAVSRQTTRTIRTFIVLHVYRQRATEILSGAERASRRQGRDGGITEVSEHEDRRFPFSILFRARGPRGQAPGVSRSEFFAKAAERYLDALEDESLTARIDAALSQVVGAEEEAAAWRQVGLAAILAATAEDEW